MYIVVDEGGGVSVYASLTDEEIAGFVGSDQVVILVTTPAATASLSVFCFDEAGNKEQVKPIS